MKPRHADDEELHDELNDARTAQVMLGDNPTFRAGMRDFVELVKQRINENGDAAQIAVLPGLERALDAYMSDPEWVGGPGYLQLNEALRPLLESFGIRPGNFGLL